MRAEKQDSSLKAYAAEAVPAEEQQLIADMTWDKDYVNYTSLIGNLGTDVEVKTLPSGTKVANVPLAVKRIKGTETITNWFSVEIWADLAEAAQQQLKKGQQVCVTGSLRVDQYIDKQGAERFGYKVIARQLARVYPAPRGESTGYQQQAPVDYDQTANAWQPADPTYGEQPSIVTDAFGQSQPVATERFQNGQQVEGAPQESSMPSNNIKNDQKWEAFFQEPDTYWDNRTTKRSDKQPDFKRKDGTAALWLGGQWPAPDWVQEQLTQLDANRMGGGGAGQAGPQAAFAGAAIGSAALGAADLAQVDDEEIPF